jgi:lipopolysaccharide export system protein LptA
MGKKNIRSEMGRLGPVLWLVALGLIWTGLVRPCWSFEKDKEILGSNRPIVITSDTLEADNKNKMATFSGTVIVKQEQPGKDPLIIYCHKIVVYYTEDLGEKIPLSQADRGEKKKSGEQNRVEKIIASGEVKIVRGKDVATGETATYYNTEQRIVLSGNPKVWQGKNLVKGDEITVWLKENRSQVTGKGSTRVQAVIHQEEK